MGDKQPNGGFAQGGRVAIGPVVTSADPMVTEMISACGYDFAWIDTGSETPARST